MLGSLLNMSSLAWSAIAAWVGVGIALGAALVAVRQVKEARRLRSEQAQPYVAVYADPSPSSPKNIDLVIKNFGSTAATDVRVKFSPPPDSAVLKELSPISTPELIPILVPGQEWRTFWDATPARHAASNLPHLYTADVAFQDSRRRQTFEFQFKLDWKAIMGRGFVRVYNVHDGARALTEISKALGAATSTDGAINIVTRDGDALDERRSGR